MKDNPEADPSDVDWISYYDPRLGYSEVLRKLKKAYPQYRWEAERKEYGEERYFSELLDYLRRLAEKLPRELRLRLVRELSAKLELPVEGAEAEKPKRKVIIDLELLAKYPLLPEAKSVVSAFRFDELDEKVYDRGCERVLEAIERGIVSARLENPLIELLSYPVAIAIVTCLRDGWLRRRHAYAEGRRVERLLMVDEPEVLELVAGKSLKSVDRADDSRFGDYRLRLREYLSTIVSCGLNADSRWKLVNRVVRRGWVYLTSLELTRVVKAVYQSATLRRLQDSSPRGVPEKIRVLAESLKPRLGEVLSRLRRGLAEAAGSRKLPPCMRSIQVRILAGEDVSHFENFTLAAYLLNTGRSVEEVLEVFKHRMDFDERVTRYQAEHIAGLRGSRTKYRPPSCSKLRSLGICVEAGRLCPKGVRNPLDYRPLREEMGEADRCPEYDSRNLTRQRRHITR